MRWKSDFAALRSMIRESADLARLVRAPVFSRDEQQKGMDAILHRMEAAPLTRRFVLTLTAKRRLFVLDDIIGAFGAGRPACAARCGPMSSPRARSRMPRSTS